MMYTQLVVKKTCSTTLHSSAVWVRLLQCVDPALYLTCGEERAVNYRYILRGSLGPHTTTLKNLTIPLKLCSVFTSLLN